MIGRVEDANVEEDNSAGFALSPRAKRYFGNMKDADGNYVLRGRASENMDANFLGYPYADSNIIPNNQTVGTSEDCTTLFYGVWSNLKVGMSNQVEFFIDPYSRSKSLETVIMAHIFADVNVAHDQAFEVVTGARV
jgi:HK97 family phage major capsid protein